MCDEMANSKIAEVKTLRRTLLKWREAILNYFLTGVTNARTGEPVRILNFKGGGRSPILVEPVSEALDFAQWWVKPMIDFTELAKLRDSGLTLREISARMGWGKTSVYRALRRYSP
jgi:hypothetical protein